MTKYETARSHADSSASQRTFSLLERLESIGHKLWQVTDRADRAIESLTRTARDLHQAMTAVPAIMDQITQLTTLMERRLDAAMDPLEQGAQDLRHLPRQLSSELSSIKATLERIERDLQTFRDQPKNTARGFFSRD